MVPASKPVMENARDNLVRLVASCRGGDADAQRQLYDACAGLVYRLAVRMVGLQDAADVAQQTFLRVFQHLDQYDGNARFETWLYRLTVNEALQHLRKRRRWNRSAPLTVEPASEGHDNDATDQRELLEQALARLDPELRAILLLRESEGVSYREIAASLNIPEGTVGSRLNRARKELQEHLTCLGWTP